MNYKLRTILNTLIDLVVEKREQKTRLVQELAETREEITVLRRLQKGETIASVVQTTKPEIIRRLELGD